MPGESAEYDLLRVLDSQADSKQDTFFIAPKEIGRSGSGLQVLTIESVGEPDAPDSGQTALFLDSSGSVKSKAPDGTISSVGEVLDPTTVDISQLQNSDTKADLTQPGGVLVSSQIPQLSITSVTTVPDQTARLNLTAQEGDVAVQTDTGEAYVLSTNDPTVNNNWVEISIDVLSQIDGQQIKPSQVGTTTTRSTIVADSVDTNSLTGVATGGVLTESRAFLSSNSSASRIPHDSISYDPDGNFDTAANEYVAPATGLYFIVSCLRVSSGQTGRFENEIRVNGDDKTNTEKTLSGNFASLNISDILELSAGDSISINNPQGKQVRSGETQTYIAVTRFR
jgi:hypothetical protein